MKSSPSPLTVASFALLALLAGLLMWPLFTGGPPPSPYLIAVLLVLRLAIQFLRARHDPLLRRPANWALDLIVIGLLFWVASNQPPA